MAFILTVIGCSSGYEPVEAIQIEAGKTISETPTQQLDPKQYPRFEDDYYFRNMSTVIERQLTRFRQKDLTNYIQLGKNFYRLKKVEESLVVFKGLVAEATQCFKNRPKKYCYRIFNNQIREKFDVYTPRLTTKDPRYDKLESTFFTGYHTHTVDGSFTKMGPFQYPLYKKPVESDLAKLSREEIDYENKLAGHNYELFYTKSLFDLYLMQVEGGGIVVINNKRYYLSYDGTNNQKWTFISKYMMEKGMIKNSSIAAQRKYLATHPEKQREIFSKCPSYVYFKYTDHPPLGSDSVPLTDYRSIATDNDFYQFKGMLTYVMATRPDENNTIDYDEEDRNKIKFTKFSRFFLDQDTGGAIQGKARVDLYFGTTRYGQFAASNLADTGQIFFLILKN